MTDFLQIVLGGVLVGAIYALIAVGFTVVYRITGVVNLAQGAFCVLAALAMWSLREAGWPIWGAAVGAILATSAIGLLLGAVSFVPGLARLSNSSMLMLTVGLLTLIQGALLVVWGSQPYTLPPFSGAEPLHLLGLQVPTQFFWIVGTAVVIVALLRWLLTYTTLGRALRACAENVLAARLMGISVRRMSLLSFGMSAGIGAIAGVVVAPTTSLEFDSGSLFTNSGFIAMAIGGIGSLPGAVAGGLLLGVVSQLATAYVSSLFSNAVALLLLLVVLLLRPSGLLSTGAARRSDVREEARVSTHITRLRPGTAWSAGGLLILALVALPWGISDPGVLSGLVIAAILFIALIGLDVVMGYGGQVNLGQAGFMALGGYASGYVTTQYDVEPLLGVLLGIALALICSVALSLVTLRLRGLYLALATLAFGLLVDSCTVGFIDITGGPSGLVGIPAFSVAGHAFDTPISMYYLVLAVDVVLVLLLSGAMRGGFGRALQAIRADQLAAAALGVNVVRTKMLAFAIAASLAALSGSLLAHFFHFLSPEMVGTNRSFELVAMLVIGGQGTLLGPAFGSVLLTLLPTLFQPLAVYKTLASGALMVLCFLYLPQGLFGAVVAGLNRLGPRRRRATVAPASLGGPLS